MQRHAAAEGDRRVLGRWPKSSTPPALEKIAHDIALREEHDLGQDAKFFALNNALFDTGIAIWDAKYSHDFVRPQTAIRYPRGPGDRSLGGPTSTQLIPAAAGSPIRTSPS